MRRDGIIVQVMLKPNCGLENTRAALVVRRIAPLCDSVSWHPRTVKSNPRTISYLRDNGLFVRFSSPTPEQVLAAIRGVFFVDRCSIVQSADNIPPFDASLALEGDEEHASERGLSWAFADRDARGKRDEELSGLLARFEETSRALRSHAERMPHDRVLNDLALSHLQAVDELRTAVSLSRIEPFDRIAPSLRKLVEDYSHQFDAPVDFELEKGHVDLDRSVLATIEETLRRALRSCIRDGIEGVEERLALGKPARATIRVRIENEGSDVVCRIEHDGTPFNAPYIGALAAKRGLLTRPLDTYTDDEIGTFLLLPRFASSNPGGKGNAFAEFNEIGSVLQHVGGSGQVRNTERGTLEISLRFPVPFTVLEVALLRAGSMRFALPAQQIVRFEALGSPFAERGREEGRQDGAAAPSAWYTSQDGSRFELLNQRDDPSVFDAASPRYVVLLDALGEKRALAADAVEGYERVSVLQLPALLNRHAARAAGCIGYAVLEDGSPCVVVSIRRLLSAQAENGGRHARP